MVVVLSFLAGSAAQTDSPKTYPALPSETPTEFKTAMGSFDYDRRDVMIPMRDGVKLRTIIFCTQGSQRRADSFNANAL